jgi:phage terminase large subunit GpA-like protein
MREDWHAKLDKLLDTRFRNAYGQDLRIRAMAVDSGYLPDEVFKYTRARRQRGVFAIKGASQVGQADPAASPSKVDFKRNGVVQKHGAEQWQVGTDTPSTRSLRWRQRQENAGSGGAAAALHGGARG